MNPRNKRKYPYFLGYKERVSLYKSRRKFYAENPELPFAALDKLGILAWGRWVKSELAQSIYSIHQCLTDCQTLEERSELMRAGRAIVNGQFIEFGRDVIAIHTIIVMAAGAAGYATGYLARIFA